jgi:hypothetical protein
MYKDTEILYCNTFLVDFVINFLYYYFPNFIKPKLQTKLIEFYTNGAKNSYSMPSVIRFYNIKKLINSA